MSETPPIRFVFAWRTIDDPAPTLHRHLDALLPEVRRLLVKEAAE